jgi:hypothetical protein
MMNLRNTLLATSVLCSAGVYAQPELYAWTMNNGQYASYWENSNGSPTNPSFVFHTTTILADVTRVCYDNNYVYVESKGMTENMGQFLNPGTPTEQDYSFKIPRIPDVPTTKTGVPLEFAIGVLKNGIPIYGLSSSRYWNGTDNNSIGVGTWNLEVYDSEGFVLDNTLGGHPQAEGKYHTHARPYNLYYASGTNAHSPIIGYAFDGYPIYGPYGYDSPMNSSSQITRMRTGYSLRNITTRTTLPDGTVLSAGQYGPAVSTTYPLGTYVEDYAWSSANNGHLDEYNGRFCVTPEYPAGTYAYFTTISAADVPEFPYYIGPEYYGTPQSANFYVSTVTTPTSGVTCFTTIGTEEESLERFEAYPNPSLGEFNIVLPELSGESLIELFTMDGRLLLQTRCFGQSATVRLDNCDAQVILLKVTNAGKVYTTKMLMK